jgi:TPP-dependent indolepyruvate ferredoxin oxidoreductase alpha subunit
MKSEKAYLKKIYVVEQTFNFIEDEVHEMNQRFTKKKVIAKKMKKIKNNKWNESE